jgi:hypothetical protein
MGPLDGASRSFPHSLSPAQNQNKAEHRQSRENQSFESESELRVRIRASSQIEIEKKTWAGAGLGWRRVEQVVDGAARGEITREGTMCDGKPALMRKLSMGAAAMSRMAGTSSSDGRLSPHLNHVSAQRW